MKTSLTPPRTLLFDWDNTLVDTWPVIHAALNLTLAHMGHAPWPMERVRRDVRKSMRESFPELFGEGWQVAAKKYQEDYASLHLEALRPLDGAEAMLRAAHARGDVFLGVVSNKRGPTLRKEAQALGWDRYFRVIVGADDAAHDKPHPAPALLALENAPRCDDPKQVWFIGDTDVDLFCAEAIGATPILYGDHAPDGEHHDGARFAAHVRDHEELAALIGAAR